MNTDPHFPIARIVTVTHLPVVLFCSILGPPIASAISSRNGSTFMGSSVNLTCLLHHDGHLPINYTWTNPLGMVISNENRTQVNVARNQDYGTYTCIVANYLGAVNANVDVLYPGTQLTLILLDQYY